jgi:hypothetical protein
MSSNVYSGLTINRSHRRFTELDFLMIFTWAAFLLVATLMPSHNQFMLWVLAGGGVFIASHMYSVVYRGAASQGYLQLAALTPVFLTINSAVLSYVNSITPVTYDALLLKWDFGISAAVRSWSVALMQPLDLVYDALPLFIVLCIVVLGREKNSLMAAFVIGSLIFPLLSLLCPAVGPAHVGDPHAPRNCMPSMHLTWTLQLWVYSKATWKWVFGAIAFLTAWATLATGEHYSLDLVGAVLFTWSLTVLIKKVQVAEGVAAGTRSTSRTDDISQLA